MAARVRGGLAALALAAALPAAAAEGGGGLFEHGGRLLATGGATQLEGSAGGGLVPWAVLSGYGTEDEIGGAAFYTHVGVQDYDLESFGASFSFWNRAEISLSKWDFEIDPLDTDIQQLVVGAKVRLFGDLVYTRWPTVALGAQYKRNLDFDLPEALGARDDDDVDVYLSAGKLFLEGAFGHPILLNTTLRATRANHFGLMGFGGDSRAHHRLMFEGSIATLVTRRFAVGCEFRQKPDNLSFAHEGPAQDVFAAYFVNKHVALVGSYAWLGNVALWGRQSGFYLSLQAGF